MPPAGLRIVGPNGSGKTTLVEAIQLLSTTRSRRGVLDSDLIGYHSGEELGVAPYCRVNGIVYRNSAEARIEVFIQKEPDRTTSRKTIKVADVPRRAMEVVGLLPTVSFTPEDMDLVIGSPSNRRRLLDLLLSQHDRQYMRHLARYQKILSQRNGLLKQIAGNRTRSTEFEYWDEQLTALGAYVIALRLTAISDINRTAGAMFTELAPNAGSIEFAYRSTIDRPEKWWIDLVGPSRSTLDIAQRVGAVYESELQKAFREDLARGVTQIGPHRDDLEISIDGRLAARFASRGQQRLTVVALKLAETEYLASHAEVAPLFILDDVLSELDAAHRNNLIATVEDIGSQMILTATEKHLLELEEISELGLAELVAPGELELR